MSLFLLNQGCWWCFESVILCHFHRQQDLPGLTFAHPEQTIKLSRGGSRVATMLHISRVPSIQQTYFSLNGKISNKLTHITLVLYGAYGLFLYLGQLRDRTTFDLSTIFLIPQVSYRRFLHHFSKESIMFLNWYSLCCSNGVWLLTKAHFWSYCVLFSSYFYKAYMELG